ncbi:MAG: protein kinase [Candidatus Methylacidiphilales bacterium]|nr:protein kinase [Candidatus Methylacidiphilales bacterium]
MSIRPHPHDRDTRTISMAPLETRAIPALPETRTTGSGPQAPEREDSGRILVVDDDILIREIVAESLMDAGYQVVTTSTPDKGQQYILRQTGNHFDCVVTDYLMPGTNGIEFARWIIRQDETLKVLLLTSEDDKEVVKASLRGGIYDFLEKPVSPPMLLESVRRAVQESRKLRAAKPRRYLVEQAQPIGEGGMGTVYLARDIELNRNVALKRLKPRGGLGNRGTHAIFKEALTLASLQHPNIVQIFDCGQDAEGPYIVMELIKGAGLDDFVKNRPRLNESELSDLARQCLQGLIAAHSLGFLHRDLKPSNIMISELAGGYLHAKLLDFGLAKFATAPGLQTADAAGNISGSVHTMAPEQLMKEPIDHRTDLYALGCVFYFAASGFMPFDGATLAEVIQNHLQHRTRHLGDVRPDFRAPFCDWIMSLMAYRPEDRPATASDARRLLDYEAWTGRKS